MKLQSSPVTLHKVGFVREFEGAIWGISGNFQRSPSTKFSTCCAPARQASISRMLLDPALTDRQELMDQPGQLRLLLLNVLSYSQSHSGKVVFLISCR